MTGERVRARVFGEVADEYDRIRPGYPPALVEDVVRFADCGERAALEVGAGTGRATLAFAAHQLRITAVEPDPVMLAVLRSRLTDAPRVSTVLSSFEEFQPPEQYGLLYSGQAWHWVDQTRGFDLAAEALAPGGAIALFWNSDALVDPAVEAAVIDAHARHVPHIERGNRRVHTDQAVAGERGAGLHHPAFQVAPTRFYEWARTLSTVDFVALLGTQSAYVLLDAEVRDALFGALIRDLPERVDLAMVTALHLARRV